MHGVERGDVELDQPIRREHELRRLEAAEGGVAVRELPLLGDHLHWQFRPLRDGDRVGPLATAGAVLEQRPRPVAGEEEHDRRGRCDPRRLRPSVPANRRPLFGLGSAPSEHDQGVREVDDDEADDRRHHGGQHRVVGDLTRGLGRPFAGRQVRPEHEDHERRRDQARDDRDDGDSTDVVGLVRVGFLRPRSGSRPCSRSSASARRTRR